MRNVKPVRVKKAIVMETLAAVKRRFPRGQLQSFSQVRRHGVIGFPVVVFGPCVEAPVGDADLAAVVFHKDGCVVAGPASVGGNAVEINGVEVCSAFQQGAPRRVLCIWILNQDAHALDAGETAHDLAIHPRDWRELAGPVGSLMWPSDPGGCVRLPFGRHAVPELPRSRAGREIRFHSSHRSRMGE